MRKKKWPFFLPRTKKGIIWYSLFALIFLLYHDFWAWGKVRPLVGGWLPGWFLYLMVLIVAYSCIAFLFTRKYWPEAPPELKDTSSHKKSGKE